MRRRAVNTDIDRLGLRLNDSDPSVFVTCQVTNGLSCGELGIQRTKKRQDLRCKIELLASVPTATLGNRGVKRKKLRGLTTVTL